MNNFLRPTDDVIHESVLRDLIQQMHNYESETNSAAAGIAYANAYFIWNDAQSRNYENACESIRRDLVQSLRGIETCESLLQRAINIMHN